MGLSNAMSGGIILFGILYVIFTFTNITETTISLNDTLFERSDLDDKRVKTSIDVIISNPPQVGDTFDFRIENTNLEKLWDFDKFDVIITYNNNDVTYTETLEYDTCPIVAGYWCIDSFNDDYVEPGILNEGESIIVHGKINNNLETNSILTIKISTANGVVSIVSTTVS